MKTKDIPKKSKQGIKSQSERKTLGCWASPVGINPEGVKNTQSVSGSPDTEFLALSPSEEKWTIQFFISREDATIITLPELKKGSLDIWATDLFEEWWLSNLFHQLWVLEWGIADMAWSNLDDLALSTYISCWTYPGPSAVHGCFFHRRPLFDSSSVWGQKWDSLS